jgi:flagellar assembly factor FliW
MQLETKRFGTIEVDDDGALTVPDGIPGFPAMKRVVVFSATSVPGGGLPGHESPAKEHALYWLQDIDNGDLAFLCVVPWVPFPDYDFEIDEAEYGIANADDVRILNLITVRRQDPTPTMTVNLRAPLVIDVRHQQLFQIILGESRWPISAPLLAPSVATNEDSAEVEPLTIAEAG